MPHKAAFAVISGAWCVLFHVVGNSSFGYVNSPSMFGWLNGFYRLKAIGESGDELCPLIPFLSAALFWRKRRELRASVKQPWTPALLLVASGLFIHVVGYLVQQVRLSVVGFLLGGFGLMGLLWGRAWLSQVVFPWFVLVFAIPVAAYTDSLTFHLRLLSTKLSVGLGELVLGMKLVRRGTTVFHPSSGTGGGFKFDIAPACSGIRSASVIFLLALMFAYLHFRSPWRRGLMVLAAVPLALLGNVVRLFVVFWVGDVWGQEAGKRIETNFGFITYLGALMGLFVLGRWLREENPSGSPGPSAPQPRPEEPVAT